MKLNTYEEPKFEVVAFVASDVIVTSPPNQDEGHDTW
jgi:hypothetical protein